MLWWCPQASFDPPGVTVAVRKDRGIETKLQPGNKFALSMVPEAQEKAVMKVGTTMRTQDRVPLSVSVLQCI